MARSNRLQADATQRRFPRIIAVKQKRPDLVNGQKPISRAAIVGTATIAASAATHHFARGLDVVATVPMPGDEAAVAAYADAECDIPAALALAEYTVNCAPVDAPNGRRQPPEVLLWHLMEGSGLALDPSGQRLFVSDLAAGVCEAGLDGSARPAVLAARGTLAGIAHAELFAGVMMI
ncbi:MAG: hypothetical protein ABSH51_13380 [Solirubrobacteraceae bacterium]